jgi:hypothetical protein
MLEHYRHTQSVAFAKTTLLPFAHEIVVFYFSHYQDWHETLVISPAQSLETWQEAINPSEQIAGIRSILSGLMALPNSVLPANDSQRQIWNDLKASMPPLPMDQDSCTAGPASDKGSRKHVAAESVKSPALAHAECEKIPRSSRSAHAPWDDWHGLPLMFLPRCNCGACMEQTGRDIAISKIRSYMQSFPTS